MQDGWVEDVVGVKYVVVNHFSKLFAQSSWARPRLDGIVFEKVSDQQNLLLIERFSVDEIEDILGHCDGDKSPGPEIGRAHV